MPRLGMKTVLTICQVHCEVAGKGECELDICYSSWDSLTYVWIKQGQQANAHLAWKGLSWTALLCVTAFAYIKGSLYYSPLHRAGLALPSGPSSRSTWRHSFPSSEDAGAFSSRRCGLRTHCVLRGQSVGQASKWTGSHPSTRPTLLSDFFFIPTIHLLWYTDLHCILQVFKSQFKNF